MLVLNAMVLAIAAPGLTAQAPPERGVWMSCLTDYAQGESMGSQTAATIAVQALATCRPERAAYWQRLVHDGRDRQAADDQVAGDELQAGRMLIRFVNQSR